MAVLTQDALDGLKDYVKRTISYAKYKVNGVYYTTPISRVLMLSNNRVSVEIIINQPASGTITVTEISLYDTENQVWLSKAENIRKTASEAALYTFIFTIAEG